MARDDKKDLPHGVVPVAAMFVGGVAARNLAAQGETRPQKALELAARLRRSGASPDTIHAETSKLLAGSPYAGVHYGRDGLPRFEVSDEQARIRPAGLDRSGRGFVGDVVQHPDLYRAHPETQLLEVQKANFTGGGFDGRTLHIGSNHVSKAMLAGRPMVKQSARGVALHEMQHAVQDAEGFAPGASPDDFETRFPGAKNAAVRDQLYITTAGEVEAENTRARRNMTAAQRRATPPSRTETVAVSEQHMGFDEGHTGMARQFGGDLPKGYSVERHTNSMGQTDYKIMHGKKQVGNAYVRDLGNKVQVGRISINEAHQRKGISTALYSQIERDLGKPVSPDDTLSDKAYKFWKKHRPEAVAAHKPTKSGGAIHDPYGLAKMLYADSEYADPETGGVRAGEVRRVQRMVEKSPPAGRTTKAAKPRAAKQAAAPVIEDFGEKIGGARKDIAKTPRRSSAEKPTGPAYERQFVAMQSRGGEWHLFKAPSGRGRRGGAVGSRVGGPFPSEAVANAAKPVAAVSTTHTVSYDAAGAYSIKRRTTKGYAPAAGGQTFPTRDDALRYMAQHVDDLLHAKTQKGFGESLLREVKITHSERVGPKVTQGDVTPEQFMKTFAPRGVEFGNWEDGARRGKLLTAVYEAMHDLSRAIGVEPSGLTMGGKLGLSFGARGTGGANSGSATYHPDYGTMNFTKPHGAGALAHEYMHAIDHMLGRLDDPALDQRRTNARGDQVWVTAGDSSFASNRVSGHVRQQQLGADIRRSMADLMKTMTTKTVTEVEAVDALQRSADYSINEARRVLDETRRGLTETVRYRARNNKPATPEQLAKFDQHAAALLAGDGGAVPYKSVSFGHRSASDVPFDHPHLRGISEVMKEVRGRSGFGDYSGSLDTLAQRVRSAQDIQNRIADAKAGVGKARTLPTDFMKEAQKLDKTRTTRYWTERHEMFARAGEAWVHDKLTARGEHSPYLVAGSKNTFEAAKAALLGGLESTPKPFPEGAERVAINAQFETLFSAMKKAGVLPGSSVTSGGAAPPVETSGLRGTQNAANLAAIVENRKANAQPAVPSRLSNMPTTGTHDIDVRGVTTEYRADAVGDPYKFKSRTHQNVGYGDDGYPKSAIIHANTLDEYEAKVAVAQKAIKDGESAAAKTRAAAEARATPAKPKAARKAKAAKVEALKPQAGQTTGQGVAQPTPPAAKLPDTKPASRTDARAAFMASSKTTKLPGGGFEVTAPDGSKMTLPNAGTEAAAKITAFAKLGSAVNKLGAVSMIAVPVAAAYVAYQGTKSQAMAEGRDGTAEAVGQAAVAAGGAAAIGYGMMKAIGGTLSVAAKLAPRIAPALGPVGLGIGVVAMGHGAYKGYQRHGIKGAALGLVGADSVLDAPAAPAPASAAQPQPVQGRLNADQKTQFATANAAYAAMKSTTENAPQKAGWTDEARIAAYVERIKRQGGTPSNIPYGGEPRKQMSGPGGRGGDSDKSRKAGNARTQ